MITVLMVAEKPSICNAIALALSGGNHETHGRTPPVHLYRGTFLGAPANFKVTSVVGHVFSTDFPSAYQSWDKVDPLTLFEAPVERVAEKKGIVHLLQTEGKGIDYLVLWLDCDREGENICFEVISCAMPEALARLELRSPGRQQRVFRAKFSAINPSDIQKAMLSLGAPNEHESLSVEARQELDLKVGVWSPRASAQTQMCTRRPRPRDREHAHRQRHTGKNGRWAWPSLGSRRDTSRESTRTLTPA